MHVQGQQARYSDLVNAFTRRLIYGPSFFFPRLLPQWAMYAMLLNEFLKEHRKVEALEKQVKALTAGPTISTGSVSAYGGGNAAFGQYSGTSSTTGWAAAQQNHSARFVVVKYL